MYAVHDWITVPGFSCEQNKARYGLSHVDYTAVELKQMTGSSRKQPAIMSTQHN